MAGGKNNQSYFIGADIGTGSAKAVAIDDKRKVLATSQYYYKVISAQPGYSEQDPEVIWKAFAKCITDVIKKMHGKPVSISMSAAMHSIMALDKNNKPLTRLLTWEDTRSNAIAERLRKSLLAKKIYEATGTPIHSMSPLCKIKWLKENQPGIFSKASKFISIKEFIWHRLFNEFEIDYSIASATGLFNIKNLSWHQPSLKFCSIHSFQLSKPVQTNFIRENVNESIAKQLLIDAETKFCIGASDGCLANLGSNASGKHIGALTIGTSGAVRVATDKPLQNFSSMIFSYILDDKTYISGGPVNNGGNVLKWMFNTFLNKPNPSDDDYKKVFEQVQKIPAGSDGLIFLPYLYGERAPVWDENASGVFIGIQSYHTTYHFFRAAMEGVCFSLNHILEQLEAASGNIKQLQVSGGFVHSKTWMQILSDITGKKLCKVQSADASCIGAALLNMKATGTIKNYQAHIAEGTIIKSDNKKTIAYKKYFSLFRQLYKTLKGEMHQLEEMRQSSR